MKPATMTRHFLRDTILPLLVFPSLSYFAFQYTIGHLFTSGLASKISSQCSSQGISSYALPYINVPSLDQQLCGLVVFFHEAMVPGDSLTFLYYFIGVGAIFTVAPAVESYRTNRSIFIAFPVLFGLLSQVLTIGATVPLYWLVFFLSGGRAKFDQAIPVTRAHAEAIIFGLFAGAAIPSICMVVMQDPTVTAIWQPYPAYVSVATLLHLAIRRPNHAQSGFSILQLFYLAAFVLASSLHFAVLWPRLDDLEAIKAFLLPVTTPIINADGPAQVLNFLKWDFTFGMVSMGIAQLWFVSELIEIPFILFWYLVAIPFFGLGAAVIAVNLWREGQIGDRLAIAKEKQS
ncbi:hypothetical protein P691DRAFT_149950 [Macrolepiota fuliginosa MF-IS2]|uniref:Uncharacterized protein n=1 Tax=Macrolepiota fuliginosa MF-IS2 TaxID=1400762 RepID=A0A9P5XL47_9AGAR|nr:hypothetical protein P691DRAFT_149950 [Macrolepiota fuliginosa MF-IS2]